MENFVLQYSPNRFGIQVKDGFIGQRMIILPKKIISSIKKKDLISQLYATDIGFFPRAKFHFMERKKGSKQYILIYCLEGQGIIDVMDTRIELKPNTYYIIPPEVIHDYYAMPNNPWSIYWVHFTGPQAKNLFEKFAKNSMTAARFISFEEQRVFLFENLINVLEDGYSIENIEYVNISLWQLLVSFVFSNFITEIGKDKIAGDIVTLSIKYMKEHLDEPLKVEAIASHFNYSNSHFFTLFKKKTGYSPIHYFNHLKIQRACQYLSYTDMSVKEISFSLGLEDPLYFSRLFKKTMNLSPLHYRAEYKH
ncbi:MAG: AraC family transcriptional regulator [Bacteroidales bacterium]|nr:AraC family transcriptional regulator [Bacteroidales bacterium]